MEEERGERAPFLYSYYLIFSLIFPLKVDTKEYTKVSLYE